VHEKEVHFPSVENKHFLQTIGKEVSGLLITAVADLGHGGLTLKPSTDPVIDTLWFPPRLLHAVVPVGLMALELRGTLLDDRNFGCHMNGFEG